MRATYPALLIVLSLTILIILVEESDFEAPHYVVIFEPAGARYLHVTLLYMVEYYGILTEVLDYLLQGQFPRQRWLMGCPKGNKCNVSILICR
jgi:hypothetical protein